MEWCSWIVAVTFLCVAQFDLDDDAKILSYLSSSYASDDYDDGGKKRGE